MLLCLCFNVFKMVCIALFVFQCVENGRPLCVAQFVLQYVDSVVCCSDRVSVCVLL